MSCFDCINICGSMRCHLAAVAQRSAAPQLVAAAGCLHGTKLLTIKQFLSLWQTGSASMLVYKHSIYYRLMYAASELCWPGRVHPHSFPDNWASAHCKVTPGTFEWQVAVGWLFCWNTCKIISLVDSQNSRGAKGECIYASDSTAGNNKAIWLTELVAETSAQLAQKIPPSSINITQPWQAFRFFSAASISFKKHLEHVLGNQSEEIQRFMNHVIYTIMFNLERAQGCIFQSKSFPGNALGFLGVAHYDLHFQSGY